ncbi:MAG TPA: M48 family metallopeptidase [Candidatus Thioglobus sp.]|nr:M48 family metallopeptidase [Candidatus Thioglobus sp.]
MQFKGQYYRGAEKFSIRFLVSTQGSIEYELENGEKKGILLDKTTMKLVGDPQTTLQISWSDGLNSHTLLCQDQALLVRMLEINLTASTRSYLLELKKQQLSHFKSEKRYVPVFLVFIAAFFFAGYFFFSNSVHVVAEMIPYEWEKKIGSFAYDNYLVGKRKVDNATVNRAIQSIVKRIDQFDGAEVEYKVAVIDAQMINAFAFPGGFVVVTTGLINSSEKPEEVAGVLSHELTHVLERHGIKKLVRQAGLGLLISIVFGDVSALSQLIELSSQLSSLSFDRTQERHADEGAIKILLAAGISPQYLASFFETIKKLDSTEGSIPEIFRTHPLTDERIKRVAGAGEPMHVFDFDIEWDKVKQAL